MRLSRNLFVVILSLSLSNLALPMLLASNASAQTANLNIALQRGYRTGYSDGYMAGYRDTIDSLAKSFSRHAEYTKADRAYNKDYGTIDEYRDGYQQGFESGYNTGFEKRSFESSLPTDLKRRGAATTAATINNNLAENTTTTSSQNQTVIGTTNADLTTSVATQTSQSTYQPVSDAVIIIPRDTELMLEMQTDVSTEKSREGDKFTAKIVSPAEIAGATVEGRISKVTKPGRLKRRSELSLSFDRIILTDARWSNFSAVLTEVMPVKGDNVKRVDAEGTAIGKSSFKDDGIKVGAATGAGLVIGAVAGGPVGAAVGAGVGAAFGVGAVVIQRGKHVNINQNQQLRIKTSYESQIR
ncbi:MAG: hypothetical protein WBO68_07680 [Pyrinomonadaceae bacterium]|nr:hypothetical protein [Acidobacteriota bacterium]